VKKYLFHCNLVLCWINVLYYYFFVNLLYYFFHVTIAQRICFVDCSKLWFVCAAVQRNDFFLLFDFICLPLLFVNKVYYYYFFKIEIYLLLLILLLLLSLSSSSSSSYNRKQHAFGTMENETIFCLFCLLLYKVDCRTVLWYVRQ